MPLAPCIMLSTPHGSITPGLANPTLPARVYADEGCAQVLFVETDEVCETAAPGTSGFCAMSVTKDLMRLVGAAKFWYSWLSTFQPANRLRISPRVNRQWP